MNAQAARVESIKFSAESMKRRSNFSLENVERFYNGLSFPLFENYVDGRIRLNIEFYARSTCSRAVLAIVEPLAFPDSELIRSLPEGRETCEFTMFVWIRDVSEIYRPVNSIVRLVLLDRLNVPDAQSGEFLFSPSIESTARILGVGFDVCDDEMRSMLDGTGIMDSKLVNKIIERGPQVMDNGTDGNRGRDVDRRHADVHDCWNRTQSALKSKLQIFIGHRLVLVRFDESGNDGLKLEKVSVGPLYMG